MVSPSASTGLRARDRLKGLLSHALAPAVLVVLMITGFSWAAGAQQTALDKIAGPQAAVDLPVLTTRELVEIQNLSGLRVSPDGRYAVVRIDGDDLATNSVKMHWQIVDLVSGKLSAPVEAGTPSWDANGALETEIAQWSADSRWIYFRAVHGEEMQIWRASREGRRVEQVTHEPADVIAFSMLQAGGLEYATAGATRDQIKQAERAEVDSGILFNEKLISGFSLTENFPYNGRNVSYRYLKRFSGPRGTLLGDRDAIHFSRNGSGRTAKLDGTALSSRIEMPYHFETGRFSGTSFARLKNSEASNEYLRADGATIGLQPSNEVYPSGRPQVRLSWQGPHGKVISCRDPACTEPVSLAVVGWSAKGDEIIFQASTLGTDWLRAWNVETNDVRTISEREGMLGSHNSGTRGACQLATSNIVCIASAPAQPSRLIAIDASSGRERVILNPNPKMTTDRLGEVRTMHLRDRFGGKAYARLVLPRDGSNLKRLPLVITSYTCEGFLEGGSGRDVPEHILAAMGYAAVCIDMGVPRTVRPSGYAPSQRTGNESAQDFFADVIQQLVDDGVVDGRRVAAAGFSGSSTSLQHMLTQTDRLAAAIVTTKGSMDLISCYLSAQAGMCARGAASSNQPDTPFDSRSGYLSSSPAWNAQRIRTPLLMQLAEVEHRDMLQLWSSMTGQGRAVELQIFPGTFHVKSIPRQRLSVYDRNLDWITFWLGNTERSVAPDQYARWRDMRTKQCSLFKSDLGDTPPVYCDAS